ncbi:tripartite tricarboxylate transporter substrate binding protein [Rossellomorea aquimaris]|uniref:Tripartite tricarboxylate transporter substrate binding protein n=1 Tax=Rossellomorea aquimaris TaxID=189382 RepID=A0A5D4UIR4_9BACI|nr:tripartite tricarboxylate transporter substrate binding protein [Rossellomorea aquimaris]TYS77932.1 tripartite tricarboxylate transporter substrate binding protein [Rossellomorea aquimaris]TYS87114.1 tripartite tricarboxylate transporter substrate binding protein [Rossellomorea aquimaris]
MKKTFKGILFALTMLVFATIMSGCSDTSSGSNEAEASDYPSKPITVVVPAGAGGDTDANARLLGKYLEKELGQPVVISNVTGAGGTVGASEVLDADPDGHTVLFFHNSLLLNRILGLTEDSYDSFKLAGIPVLDQGNTFMVSGDSKFENLQDMVEYARAHPGEVSIATEVGGFTHLQLLALQKDQDIELNIVDVGGAAEKVTALLGEHVDIVPTSLGLVKDYVESGDMRSLGIMASDRVDLMPDVPTFVEQGVNSEFEKFFFYGFNPDTPDEIVDEFSKAIEKVVNNEEYVKEAEKFLVTPTYLNQQEAFEYIKKAEEKYIELNKE